MSSSSSNNFVYLSKKSCGFVEGSKRQLSNADAFGKTVFDSSEDVKIVGVIVSCICVWKNGSSLIMAAACLKYFSSLLLL